jgi:hypothetical protein
MKGTVVMKHVGGVTIAAKNWVGQQISKKRSFLRKNR